MDLAHLIDHTLLSPICTLTDVERICNEAIPKQHAFVGDPVQVRRVNQFIRIGRDGPLGVIVRHDEQYIRSGKLLFFRAFLGAVAGAE